ncbi:MAG: hypothetical protein JSU72_00465 [Deltaproteobacteria bacterium]|nr:MAG: hypothetical protein JSU72_00465 [Deltaproteobacteria bacterium]
MEEILLERVAWIPTLLLTAIESKPWSHGYRLAEEKASRVESQPQQLGENWLERDDTERREAEENRHIHDLMENIKRYIRNIDINNL